MIGRVGYAAGAVGAAALGGTLIWAGTRTKADAEQTRLLSGGGYGGFGGGFGGLGGFGGGYNGYGGPFNNVTNLADGASGALLGGGALAAVAAGVAGMKAFSKKGTLVINQGKLAQAKDAISNLDEFKKIELAAWRKK